MSRLAASRDRTAGDVRRNARERIVTTPRTRRRRESRMARRQARFTAQELADDPRLRDHSSGLWREGLGDVQRGLLTSAVRCFAANGFHATTTRDIAEGVGLSPAALYVHFPSKELVLFEIVRTGHERVLTRVQDPAVLSARGDELRRTGSEPSSRSTPPGMPATTWRRASASSNCADSRQGTTTRSWSCATGPTRSSATPSPAASPTGRSRRWTSSGSRGRCCRSASTSSGGTGSAVPTRRRSSASSTAGLALKMVAR